MKIGELARKADVAVDTVRFYERRGLLPAPVRTASGYRSYTEASVERLCFARELRQLGFSLDDIAGVLADVDRGTASCASQKGRFEAVLARIDERIAELRSVRRRLVRTLDRCATGRCEFVE